MARGNNPYWDIRVAEGEARQQFFTGILVNANKRFLLLEVKSEINSQPFGTLFIEHSQRGRPSGLAVTQADWHVIEPMHDVFVVLSTERLKRLWQRVMDTEGERPGGWGKLQRGARVPRHWLIDKQPWEDEPA